MPRASAMDTLAGYWPYAAFPISWVACSGGMSNILYCFGLGAARLVVVPSPTYHTLIQL